MPASAYTRIPIEANKVRIVTHNLLELHCSHVSGCYRHLVRHCHHYSDYQDLHSSPSCEAVRNRRWTAVSLGSHSDRRHNAMLHQSHSFVRLGGCDTARSRKHPSHRCDRALSRRGRRVQCHGDTLVDDTVSDQACISGLLLQIDLPDSEAADLVVVRSCVYGNLPESFYSCSSSSLNDVD